MYVIDKITKKKVKVIKEYDNYYLVEHISKSKMRYKLSKAEAEVAV